MQTSQSLSQDNAALSVAYLARLVALQADKEFSTVETTFHAAKTDLWVNGLWFVSLTLSLAVALFTVLAKQWLRQYMSIVTGTPRERSFIRQFRYDGLMKWRVPTIVGILPVTLHLAVVLFLIGLTIFLAPLSWPMASTVATMTILIILLYIVSTVLPLFDPQCPYRTTFTNLIHYLHRRGTQLMWIMLYSLQKKFPPSMHRLSRTQFGTRKRISDSFDSVERKAASPSKREDGDQQLELHALTWLANTTSSPSAMKVVFESLGAFDFKMATDLDWLRRVFGIERWGQPYLYSDSDDCERGIRAIVHVRWRHSDIYIRSTFTSSHRLAVTKLAAGIWVKSPEGRMIDPGEGVIWAFTNVDANERDYISHVVWAGLFQRAEGLEGMPLADVPYGLLNDIRYKRVGGYATPSCLGSGVTMADVARELCRRDWPVSAEEALKTWNSDTARGERGDGVHVEEWLDRCQERAGWWARANARMELDLEADEGCYAEWEEEAREAIDVLISVGREAELKMGFAVLTSVVESEVDEWVMRWTERLAMPDLESQVERWKEYRSKRYDWRLALQLQAKKNDAARKAARVKSGARRQPLSCRIRECFRKKKVPRNPV